MLKINRYVLLVFLKSFCIVVGSASVVISTVVISQQLFGMPFTKSEATIILTASLLAIWRFIIVFFISMTTSLMFMELGRTSQYIIMLSSGINVTKILKGVIIFSFFLGIMMIFFLKNLEIKLTEKSELIIQKFSQSQEININLKDIDANKNIMIINGDYSEKKLELKNALFIKQNNNAVFEVIKAEKALFAESNWTLKNVYILNNNNKLIHNYNNLVLSSSLTKENFLKQIDASQKSLIKTFKQYTLFELYNALSGRDISNEDLSKLKIQFWSTLALPIKLIYALMIVPILIGTKTITRNGLKLNAIFIPQIAVGVCDYVASFFAKIATGAMKYEFALCFLPHLAILLLLLLVLSYKNYV